MIQNGFIKDYPNITYDSNMRIYLHNLLIRLGRRLNVRQVALATAEVYLTRFLLKVLLKEINVYLMVTTCIYVACKIEECPQHIRLIVSEARNLWPEYIPHDITKLAEFEFYLLEEMDLYLMLYHPYRSLIQIKDFLNDNFNTYQFQLTNDELQHSWSLINDSYITDLPLLFPPHIIAITAVYITIVLKKSLNSIKSNKDNNPDGGANGSEVANNKASIGNPANQNVNSTNSNNSNNGSTNNSINSAHGITVNNNSNSTNTDPNSNDAMSNDHLSGDLDPDNMNAEDRNSLMNLNNENLETNSGLQDMKIDEDTIKINKFMNFLGHSHVNLDEIVEAMQDMINVYVIWNRYNENAVKKELQYMLLNR